MLLICYFIFFSKVLYYPVFLSIVFEGLSRYSFILISSSYSTTIRINSRTISLFCLFTRRYFSFPPAHILTTARKTNKRKGRKKSATKAVRKTKKSHLVFLWWYQLNKFFTFYETVTNYVRYNWPRSKISWRRLYFSRIFRFFFFLYIKFYVPCWNLQEISVSIRSF